MLETILLSTLLIYGVSHITEEGWPLYFVRKWMDGIGLRDEPRTWYYPVLYCSRCMSSLWTAGVYFLTTAPSWATLYEIPICMLGTFGAVYFLTNQEVEES
jgi:hypothetical protein